MKKLIAIAAVVVAGSVFAIDGYNFTATLKTTKGKKAGTQTTTYNLGVDQYNNFWYDDHSITNLRVNVDGVVTNIDLAAKGYAYAYFNAATNTDTKEIRGKKNIKSLKLVNKKGTLLPTGAGYLANPTPEQEALVILLAAKYNKKSDGLYCEQVKIDSAGCYRVAGSAKIDIALFTTNCCEVGGGTFTNIMTGVDTKWYNFIPNSDYGTYDVPLTNETVTAGITMSWGGFIQRFGALTSDKANKVEMYADVFDMPTMTDGRWFEGVLAGQGTWSNGRVASVSGNIVGIMDPAICTYCCDYPDVAVAFECDLTYAQDDLDTAAFGTFRLKYNSKLK